MRHDHSESLSPLQMAHVLDGLIYEQVRSCIDFAALAALEKRIAIELARLPDTTDDEMLALARATVTRTLHEVARRHRRGEAGDDPALSTRYLNALCCSVDLSSAGE